mgnify:CR=1 FL=1
MKRFLGIALAAILAVGVLAGCGDNKKTTSTPPASTGGESKGTEEKSETAAGPEYEWKLGLNTSPGDIIYESMEVFEKTIEESSGGKIAIDIYAGGVLGDWRDCIEGLAYGMCDVFMESLGTLDAWSEYANIDAVPYLYSGYDHFMKVWSSDLGDEIREKVGEDGGFKLLGSMYRGVRITAAKQKMEKLADFKGFKLRAPNIQVYLETWKRIGATPTPLAITETFTAIQQGTVDGQENPLLETYNYAFYDVCKYIIRTDHVYSQSIFMMDRNYYDSLPAEIQDYVKEAAQAASDYKNAGTLKAEEDLVEKFKEKGCEIVQVDKQEFIDLFDGFVDEIFPFLSDWAARIKAMDV